jgi:septal ring factor EnvC (AmiA/AmiB activator)
VTFICSKTDDISVTEAAESLGIETEIHDSWCEIERLNDEIKQHKSAIADLRDEREACDDLIDKAEQSWDKWDALLSKLSSGVTVFAPHDSPGKKRKRQTKPRGSRKNGNSSDIDDSDYSDTEDFGSSDKENEDAGEGPGNQEPLTEEQIEEKLAALKAEKKEIRARKKEIEEQVMDHRNKIKELIAERDVLNFEVKATCIQGKNGYSNKQ